MIARLPRVIQWGLFAGVFAISGASYGQSYSNPKYQGSTPKKGQSVQLPSYGTPVESGSQSPSYSPAAESAGVSSEHTMQIGVNVQLPIGIGDGGGGLKSKFGANAQVYFSPLVSDDFNNYVSVGWDLFGLKSDADTKLNIIPVAFGLEFKPDSGKMFQPKFGIAAGGAYAWISVPNAQTVTGRGYFLAQVKPGLDVNMDGWTIVAQMPVSFLIGSSRMSYIAYSLGARFGI